MTIETEKQIIYTEWNKWFINSHFTKILVTNHRMSNGIQLGIAFLSQIPISIPLAQIENQAAN